MNEPSIQTWQFAPFVGRLDKNEGYVYVAEAGTGHIKIGKSKTPCDRIRHFDTIMPVEVRILSWFYCDDYHRAEQQLQDRFSDYHHKGEWFLLPDERISEATSIFCYIDGEFHWVQQVERRCCWHTVHRWLRRQLDLGLLSKTTDYLPY